MNEEHPSFLSVSKHPSAFVPMLMSAAALLVMFLGPLIFHDLHAKDEGPTAHLWQILMAGQLPLVLFFAVKWIRLAPRPGLGVLAVQAGAVAANVATVFLLGVG